MLGHIYSRTYLAAVTSPVLTALEDDSREVEDDELTREADDDDKLSREVVNDVGLENEEFPPPESTTTTTRHCCSNPRPSTSR